MGNLHPMKQLMAIKLSGSSSGPRICFFFLALYKESSVNTKNPKNSKLFDFHSDGFFCKLLLLAAVF